MRRGLVAPGVAIALLAAARAADAVEVHVVASKPSAVDPGVHDFNRDLLPDAARGQNPYHVSTVRDPGYAPQWRFLFGAD